MSNIQAVTFLYSTRLGRFVVSYASDRVARLFSLGYPVNANRSPRSSAVSLTDMSEVSLDSDLGVRCHVLPDGLEPDERVNDQALKAWRHGHDVKADIARMGADQLIVKYRDIFISSDLPTFLEEPHLQFLARVEFPITVHTGDVLTVVLRSDGRGFVVGDLKWTLFPDGEPVTYRGTQLYPSFHHQVTNRSIQKIIDDEALMMSSEPDDPAVAELRAAYEEYFWSDINSNIDFSWIRNAEEIKAQPLSFERGTRAEFESLIADAARVDRIIWKEKDYDCAFIAESGACGQKPYVSATDADNRDLCIRTLSLMEAILDWENPTGFDIRIRGENRLSWEGYSRHTIGLYVYVNPPTASERIEALERLLLWSEANGVDIEDCLPDENWVEPVLSTRIDDEVPF